MVAGATGIDLFMLVVAADDGVMPQTREHLAVLRALGVEAGVVALTKADAVEADALELARSDAASLGAGEPIVVSARTGEGLDRLRGALAGGLPPAPARGGGWPASGGGRGGRWPRGGRGRVGAPPMSPRCFTSTASSACTASGRWRRGRSGPDRSRRGSGSKCCQPTP